jgi:Na+-translocating ferredoxin:NAD+ oxidoreductase RnfG subunit
MYNADTGLFNEVSLRDIAGYDKLGKVVGGTNINNLSSARRKANEAIRKANEAIKQMGKFKEYNNSTAGKSEQELSNFFVLEQPVMALREDVKVTGTPVSFEAQDGSQGSVEAPKPIDRVAELEGMLDLIRNETMFNTLPPETQQQIMNLVGR